MFAVVDGAVEVTRGGHIDRAVRARARSSASSPSSTRRPAARRSPRRPRQSRVVRVDKKHFTFLVQEHPTFALQVMAVMADRLRRAKDAHAPG